MKQLQAAMDNQAKIWKALKTFWPLKSKCTNINSINGHTEPQKIACALNSYFATIGSELVKQFDDVDAHPNVHRNPPIF